MKYYIAVKKIVAEPMNLGQYNLYRGWTIPLDEDPERPGYLVKYSDGCQSWSPKEAFDKSHLELTFSNKITEEVLDRFIGSDAFTNSQIDEKTTLVKMVPRTGFVQYEVSSCVDPANYDHQLGVDLATKRLKDRLWPLLGFVLQWANNGLK